MQKLSKFYYFFLSFILFALLTTYYLLHTTIVDAQDPIPKLLLPCDETDNNEFHSLRPYQAAPCGGSPQALFCSNKLVIFESFQLDFRCRKERSYCESCNFTCHPDYQVEAHDLNITLDESEFPIMGNTQDDFDDAQKVNEYASWYLSGVNDKRENKEATNEQVVNFSGPVKKLLPSMIQDAQRIKIINSPITMGTQAGKSPPPALEVDDDLSNQPDNHDQFVVDNERLTDWLKDLSFLRLGALAWDKRYPPLPWSDQNGKPFKSQVLYRKAYNEWLGKSCAIVPIFGLVCVDIKLGPIDIITNKYADLWHFVPLSNNSDKKGKNYLLTGDGPSYVPSKGTEIDNAQHKSYKNAPLYFAHTQEVKDLSGLLNQTYWPADYESEPLPETTEKIKKGIKEIPTNPVPNPVPVPPTGNSSTGSVPAPAPAPVPPSRDPYATVDCSAVNVRVNEGDNLFPGDRPDNKELYVEGAEYLITEVECHEEYKREWVCEDKNDPTSCYWDVTDILNCPAEVGIEFKLGTQTPFANEIFSDTVADSGSTFRKIFPKVEEGAPVECIADIPTQTNVTYSIENDIHESPAGGTQTFVQKAYPADGAGDSTQLTFPHVGSVYEYFLKGIQTALRPKGYGDPIANGNCKPTNTPICGELPEDLPKGGGACSADGVSSRLGDLPQNLLDIVSAAAEAYQVPPNLILGIMFGEGRFNSSQGGGYTTYDWTEENVNKWATCEEMPSCYSIPYVYNAAIAISEDNWGRIVEGTSETKGIKDEIKKFAPDREISGCNLLDSIYGIAWLMRDDVNGGPFQINSCFGKTLNKGSSSASSCGNWSDEDYITAIKINESGWSDMCFTNDNSCATGGGKDAACITGGDTCQKYNDPTGSKRYTSPSHMACVFDVAKGN